MDKINLSAARKIVGSIGFPRKMPGTSYGLSAHDCIAGRELAKLNGSICSLCYALRDMMSWPNAQKAYARRLKAITDPLWVEAMVLLLNHIHSKAIKVDLGLVGRRRQKNGGTRFRYEAPGFHRWHDTGDLQSLNHLEKIIAVCDRTPSIMHWLPTREAAILRSYKGPIPANLTIRLSATMIDGKPPPVWPTTSTVHSDTPLGAAHECPAPKQNHRCMSCRACWSRDVALVSYRLH